MQGDARFADDGRLHSERYGDVYFSGDGVRETEHVFVGGNDLADRFAKTAGTFVVGETGFGTGLNFLVAAKTFLRHAPANARLVFVTTELHAMGSDVMQAVHARLPGELQELAAELRRQFDPQSHRASQRLTFADGRLVLRILFGDAEASLRNHCFTADAWFLDGFSPARNPAMWSFELLREVARHTTTGGTFATYTVAGQVRRSLQDAGFAIERAAGFGQKREMLKGARNDAEAVVSPARIGNCGTRRPAQVRVLGAGIAGATAARAFADAGLQVQVVDPHGIATGASGIPAAIVRPRLWIAGNPTPDAEIIAQAFRYTATWLQDREHFRRCGALICATDEPHADLLRQRVANPATAVLATWLEPDAASAQAGTRLPHGAAWLPTAGSCDLAGLTKALLDHERIEVRPDTPAAVPELVVQANARGFRPVRGQALAVRWAGSDQPPQTVLCTSGYVSPPGPDGVSWLGSTFDRDVDQSDERPDDDERIRAHFRALPEVARDLARAETTRRFVGVRQTSADRLPVIGMLDPDTPCLASLAHGSRGAVTAPWAAELLTRMVLAEPLPLSADHWQRLRAGR